MSSGEVISVEHIDELIDCHMGFIIRTVSNMTGRYVSTENDDEFSIALSAFAEAVERYRPERGAFLSFAGLVIRSRLSTYLEREKRYQDTVSLEGLAENGQEPEAPLKEDHSDFQEEIYQFQKELSLFALTLEDLAENSPRHHDTRERAVTIAEKSSREQVIVDETYRKRKLPIRRVAKFCSVSEKIVKDSKLFILATMLIFLKKFPMLLNWVGKGRKLYV